MNSSVSAAYYASCMTDRDRHLSHLHSIQICSPLKMVEVAYPYGQIGRDLKLTAHLYQMLR